jgi:hypothetical protein
VRHYGALASVLVAQWNNLCGIDDLFIKLSIKEKIVDSNHFFKHITDFGPGQEILWTLPSTLARQHENASIMNYEIGLKKLPCWQKSLLVGTKVLMIQNARLTFYQLMPSI